MNIVFDCERVKYPYTGLFTFCSQLGAALISAVEDQDKLSFFVPPNNVGFLGNEQMYIKQHFYNKLLPVYMKGLNIWHATHQLSEYSGGDRKTKKVLTVHDLNYLYTKNSPSTISKYNKKHQKILDSADSIVAISQYVKRDILEHLDTKGKEINVIYNGYEVREYPEFNSPEYKPERPFILALGTVVYKKNFHVLPALLRNNDYELIIAGVKSDYVDKIEEFAQLHNVADRVKFLGAISDKQKYWYLKNCMAFAFPSLTEGFGLPVMEAMHFGKPVFLSNRTSLPEIGGEYAYYFNDFTPEHMQEVFVRGMEDYTVRDRVSSIIQHATSFSWETCAENYYNIYKSLL
ncbi:MAG: glycosyltransferase family 4 protein [Dysgonomonas sp.]